MRILGYIFSMVLLFSCSKEQKPDGLLSKEKMTDLLYDLTLQSSLQSSVIQKKDSLLIIESADDILKKYQLDSISFKEQHRYYINQPEMYATMFDSIQKRLDRAIKKAEARPDDPEDSLRVKKMLRIDNITR